MNINVVVTVGTFACDVTVTDTDHLALGDILNQISVHTLAMVGTEAIKAAAVGVVEAEGE